LILDAAPIVHLDSTGADTIAEVADTLSARGIRLTIAAPLPQVRRMLDRSGALAHLGPNALFPTLRAAVDACGTADAPALTIFGEGANSRPW